MFLARLDGVETRRKVKNNRLSSTHKAKGEVNSVEWVLLNAIYSKDSGLRPAHRMRRDLNKGTKVNVTRELVKLFQKKDVKILMIDADRSRKLGRPGVDSECVLKLSKYRSVTRIFLDKACKKIIIRYLFKRLEYFMNINKSFREGDSPQTKVERTFSQVHSDESEGKQ